MATLERKAPARQSTRKVAPAARRAPSSADLDDLGPLPRGYGEDTIFLIAQDPHWLFTYWDIEISRHPGGPCYLRVLNAAGAAEQEIEVTFETRNWYVPVRSAGGTYQVEIGFYRGKKWNSLAKSLTVATPRDRLSDSAQFDFATLPLHISFQRLVETIEHSFAAEPNLVPALALLQKSLSSSRSSDFPLAEREHVILTTLLGSDFLSLLSSGGWSSEELHSAIYQRLRERLSSGELGELVGRLQLGQAESSLFSAFSQLGAELTGGSWNISSAGFAERFAVTLSSWLTGALTSWMSAAQSSWSGGVESSWGSSEVMASAATGSSQTLAGFGSLASWSGAELSSTSQITSSGLSTSWNNLSSWLRQVNSSWSGVNMSSFAQSALSSWSNEILSSFGFAASSWGAAENSAGLAAARSFDFEVNAEITLRGQTHPQSRLLIGGNPVALGTDGSFKHTFVFRGGRGEIPIEATSPDGGHIRRTAILLQPASI